MLIIIFYKIKIIIYLKNINYFNIIFFYFTIMFYLITIYLLHLITFGVTLDIWRYNILNMYGNTDSVGEDEYQYLFKSKNKFYFKF